MKRFSFNLQKIMELRSYREQEAKVELGRAVGVLTAIENRIKETALMRHNAAKERFADPAAMPAWDHYIIRLDQEAERLAREAARAELALEEKRALYLEASRELKVMEKLKERREKEYRKEMFGAETAELDDMWRGGDALP
ncbi:MAG: flagellar export protein FliJ [Treponema sp.]|jgi:flagellar FliJ protein|nr:flagellar export protein FliJ [Treponema sp.]